MRPPRLLLLVPLLHPTFPGNWREEGMWALRVKMQSSAANMVEGNVGEYAGGEIGEKGIGRQHPQQEEGGQ